MIKIAKALHRHPPKSAHDVEVSTGLSRASSFRYWAEFKKKDSILSILIDGLKFREKRVDERKNAR